MHFKGFILFALLLIAAPGAVAQAAGDRTPAAQAPAATTPRPAAAPAAAAPRPLATTPASAPKPAAVRPAGTGAIVTTPAATTPTGENTNCENGPCDAEPAHISIATPAPEPAPWPWQERIAWVANILLVILGYVGIMIGISTLKKIAQQTQYVEAAAEAAAETAKTGAETAKAALEQVQAIVRAERPWVLVTVEPSRKMENRFTITATNRGRGPARIVSAVDKITTEVEESKLPETPELKDAKTNASLASAILLPGESAGIGSFGRDEVKDFCGSDAKLKRVENWEEMILLYGKIVYQDLMAAGSEQQHETSWCFWYIHGRRNSGMVPAGPVTYHRHT